VHVDEVLDYHY